MSSSDDPPKPGSGRRGLSSGPIQRSSVAVLAIRVIRTVQRVVWLGFEVLLAAIILFEEWGWRPLAAALAWLSRFNAVARLEAMVVALPPWPALAVFLVPSVLFLPLKLAALWLIANGQVLAATLLFLGAKIAGTALYARIFQLTQPALMRLAWFASLYTWFVRWKDLVLAHARSTQVWQAALALKARIKAVVASIKESLRPTLLRLARWLRASFRG